MRHCSDGEVRGLVVRVALAILASIPPCVFTVRPLLSQTSPNGPRRTVSPWIGVDVGAGLAEAPCNGCEAGTSHGGPFSASASAGAAIGSRLWLAAEATATSSVFLDSPDRARFLLLTARAHVAARWRVKVGVGTGHFVHNNESLVGNRLAGLVGIEFDVDRGRIERGLLLEYAATGASTATTHTSAGTLQTARYRMYAVRFGGFFRLHVADAR